MPARLRRLLALASAGVAGASCAGALRSAPPSVEALPSVERIVFVGDSLVNRSEQDHGLLERVLSELRLTYPGAALDLVNAGRNGDCIADIRARLPKDVLALRPAAVVLYWDSDAADAEDARESPAHALALRAAYERDLAAVLSSLREATPHVVVSGPTLLGERPHGRNPKDHVLDAYAEINRRLAHAAHATWVDTRRAAFHWLHARPLHPEPESGRLTEDGEHLSQAGTELVASRLAAALGHSLGGRTDGPAVFEEPPPGEPDPP